MHASPESTVAAAGFPRIVGRSRGMQRIFDMVGKVADSGTTLLVTGETGTGKGLIARAVHARSGRADQPFVQINCGAIPEGLLESELFGHVRGAFTGATAAKTGKFEQAHGGTIFLDEIGDMSADLQVKLLRVLEEREFEAVGGTRTIRVDVRVIAATHRDLEEAVQKGSFREDLFYRLHVIPLQLPPLRERERDIDTLADRFLEDFSTAKGTEPPRLSDAVRAALLNHDWPGNVRELKNLMERLSVLCAGQEVVLDDLPVCMARATRPQFTPSLTLSDDGICLNTAVCEFEKSLILQSLERTQWVKNKAAKLLHLNRTTLVEKIKRHDLQKFAAAAQA